MAQGATIKNSYIDTKNESKIIAQGSNNVGGFIGQSPNNINTIEQSGIYQGTIVSGSQAGNIKNNFVFF